MTRLNQCSGKAWHDQVDAAHARRAAVLDLIAAKPMTVPEIIAITKTTARIARGDLANLMSRELVHSVIDPTTFKVGKSCAMYHFGEGPARGKGAILRQATVKSWAAKIPPMFEPMAYLFGRVHS